MNRIGGIIYRNGAAAHRESLALMASHMADTKPVSVSSSSDESVGFFTASYGCDATTLKPLRRDMAGYLVMGDVTLYDREELAKQLNITGQLRQTVDDLALVSLAYRRWGKGCLQYLNGDFAFAIWNTHDQSLFCARDYLGIRPLYFLKTNNRFAFASEISALRVLSWVKSDLNQSKLADFIVDELEGIDWENTAFKSIKRLLPGHHLIFNSDIVTVDQYESLTPDSVFSGSEAEYLSEFKRLLNQSVCRRIQPERSNMITLSGGLDSSAICHLAQTHHQHNRKVETISALSSQNANHIENRSIQTMRTHLDLPSNGFSEEILCGSEAEIFDAIAKMDDPYDTLPLGLIDQLYRRARQYGASIVLDGIDADLVLDYYGASLISEFIRVGKWCKVMQQSQVEANALSQSMARVLWSSGLKPMLSTRLPMRLKHRIRQRSVNHVTDDFVRQSLISPSFAEHCKLNERVEMLMFFAQSNDCVSLYQRHSNRIQHPYLLAGIERYERCASRYAIQARHPFLDRELVKFCISLPVEMRSRYTESKWLLRESLKNELPKSIIGRLKNSHDHLAADYIRVLIKHERESASTFNSNISHYLDQKKSEIIWEDIKKNNSETIGQQWKLLSLNRWLDTH